MISSLHAGEDGKVKQVTSGGQANAESLLVITNTRRVPGQLVNVVGG